MGLTECSDWGVLERFPKAEALNKIGDLLVSSWLEGCKEHGAGGRIDTEVFRDYPKGVLPRDHHTPLSNPKSRTVNPRPLGTAMWQCP